jgi:hypothetical protein
MFALRVSEGEGCPFLSTFIPRDALSYRPFADALQDAQLNLGAMDGKELKSAIALPAATLNVQLESGLTQRLIDAVLDAPSNLPLLEFTLTQLWQKQQLGES